MAKKRNPTFLKEGYTDFSKLGLRRKKLLKYRKARGGDNKMRKGMKGHLRNVTIGFRGDNKDRYLISGLMPVMIYNLNDLKNIKKGEIAVLAKVGNKNRLEIAEYSMKHNVKVHNLKNEKFMKKIEEYKRLRKEEEKLRNERKMHKKSKEEKKQEKETLSPESKDSEASKIAEEKK